jgi:ribosomal subunit interface protein
MSNEIQIVFHNLDQSDAIIDNVNKHISKLQRYSNDILGGRVVLDSPHNNQTKGKVYAVAIELHTPSREVVVKQDQHDKHAHEDLYVAIRDAFNAAERQLKSVDKKHRKVPLSQLETLDAPADAGDAFEDEDEGPDLPQYAYN